MNYPKHVAIIPDWNRTRAKANDRSVREAYWISYENGVDIIDYTASKTDIEVITLWGLSTENAKKRPKEEFDFLMNMHKEMDWRLDKILTENQINFKRIGNPEWITEDFKNYLLEKEKRLSFNSKRYCIFWVNYWGRDEIIRWIQDLAKQGKNLSNITEEEISKSLQLWNIPPIELVIRTKWDQAQRTSWFMSRWIGYAELYFTAKKCPEFGIPAYQEALKWFDNMSEMRNYWK